MLHEKTSDRGTRNRGRYQSGGSKLIEQTLPQMFLSFILYFSKFILTAKSDNRPPKIDLIYDRTVANLRACSHEPGAVNYPGVMIAAGASVTSCSHDDLLSRGNIPQGQLHCPGASSSSSDHYEFIWIPLVFTQIVTDNEF